MSWQVGLYVAAVLIPLAAFAVEAIFIRQLKRFNAYLATGAIGFSCLLSLIGFIDYYGLNAPWRAGHEASAEAGETEPGGAEHGPAALAHHGPVVWSADVNWVLLGGRVGSSHSGPPSKTQLTSADHTTGP